MDIVGVVVVAAAVVPAVAASALHVVLVALDTVVVVVVACCCYLHYDKTLTDVVVVDRTAVAGVVVVDRRERCSLDLGACCPDGHPIRSPGRVTGARREGLSGPRHSF